MGGPSHYDCKLHGELSCPIAGCLSSETALRRACLLSNVCNWCTRSLLPLRTHTYTEYEPIVIQELKGAIKKLKRRKSLGPDKIPNEIFIEADSETRNIFCKMIKEIHSKEKIPESWLEGEIKRLYKGKGIKGKCSNERGITLASNVGKVYERILNERIKRKYIPQKRKEVE